MSTVQPLSRVRLGFSHALRRPHALRSAMAALVAVGAAYAASIALLGVGGGTPGSAPWLAVPRDSYFLIESTFTAPVIVGSAVLAAAVASLLARAARSAGSFDDTVVAIAWATSAATLFSLVPDFLMGVTTTLGVFDGSQVAADLVRPSPWRAFLWTYLCLYAAAFLVLYPAAVSAAHPRLRAGAALAVGWSAFAVYQGVLLVFIR